MPDQEKIQATQHLVACYMVHRPNSRGPAFRHATLESAMIEAARVHAFRGDPVTVLASVCQATAGPDGKMIWQDAAPK